MLVLFETERAWAAYRDLRSEDPRKLNHSHRRLKKAWKTVGALLKNENLDLETKSYVYYINGLLHSELKDYPNALLALSKSIYILDSIGREPLSDETKILIRFATFQTKTSKLELPNDFKNEIDLKSASQLKKDDHLQMNIDQPSSSVNGISKERNNLKKKMKLIPARPIFLDFAHDYLKDYPSRPLPSQSVATATSSSSSLFGNIIGGIFKK